MPSQAQCPAVTPRTLLVVVLLLGPGLLGCPSPSGESAAPTRTPPPDGSDIEALYDKTDPASLIGLHSPEEVEARRAALARLLWGEAGYPRGRLPDAYAVEPPDTGYEELPNLSGIDVLRVEMAQGIDSWIHHLRPAAASGTLVVYAVGHGNEAPLPDLAVLLEEGHAVLVVFPPFWGPNPKPIVELPGLGSIWLHAHKQFPLLEGSQEGSPIRFFVEPVAAALNHAMETFDYRDVVMVGLSGGGWLTVIYAALDDRIRRSYPVAGALPLYLRSKRTRDWGDYEQNHPPLYRTANYLELFVLGSLGEGRGQLQVFNRYDSCCFAGDRALHYEPAVRRALTDLGPGSFRVLIDDSHREHKISEGAWREILRDMSHTSHPAR